MDLEGVMKLIKVTIFFFLRKIKYVKITKDKEYDHIKSLLVELELIA